MRSFITKLWRRDRSPPGDVDMQFQAQQPDEPAPHGPKYPVLAGSPVHQTTGRRAPIPILIMGRSGSGKSQFINAIRANPDQLGFKPNHLNPGIRTRAVKSSEIYYALSRSQAEITFKLIDTPGFDNIAMSDVDAFAKITEYLVPRIKQGLAGIVYIHSVGDTFRSRVVQQNLRTMVDLFLGRREVARLTILVTQTSVQREDLSAVFEQLCSSTSIISEACARATGPRILPDQTKLIDIIKPYAFQPLHRIPINSSEPSQQFISRLELCLGCDPRSMRALFDEHERRSAEIESNSKREVAYYQNKCERIEKLNMEAHNLGDSLRRQLQQIQLEYAALRSQVQEPERHEQEMIVEAFRELNYEIDELGQSITEYLAKDYVQDSFGKDPLDVTTLDARNLPRLKALFRHEKEKSSLLMSSTGASLDVESFFEYSIRNMLCTFLNTRIFQPFHPYIDESGEAHKVFETIKLEVRRQQPQYLAGKWRSVAFRSIQMLRAEDMHETVTKYTNIDSLAEEFRDNHLHPLFQGFFGHDIPLNQQPWNSLKKLIKVAWDGNSKLKAEVITLGDYNYIAYPPDSLFDAALMEVYDPERNRRARCRPNPTTILGTVALGFVCYRAIGGGQAPERIVLQKALVATDDMYAKATC